MKAGFDETALVERARAGDDAAFAELVNEYERKIYRLARNITQNDEDAEDVLQEAFLKAYQHLDRFQGDSKFYTWIVRIAVNEALMKLRKRRGDKIVSLDEEIDTGEETMVREIAVWDGNPEQKYSQEELRVLLDDAIQSLKPSFRSVFQLRDVDELSTEETAEALNPHFRFEPRVRISRMLVRINIHRGLKAAKTPAEDSTQWVTNKTSPFSSRSTAFSRSTSRDRALL
ncbi:MAG: sigma-70 family RNA polymerase sigma factor, partial [Acidobacteria bacterium]|nr:sigma-70 family RNA polymerase sigma factor [Acidobacteriota bacterium]